MASLFWTKPFVRITVDKHKSRKWGLKTHKASVFVVSHDAVRKIRDKSAAGRRRRRRPQAVFTAKRIIIKISIFV